MSINIGMSGLKSTAEQMNTISHNIANVGTAGYKASRTEFQDIYAPEFGGGQMNGVEVAATRQSFLGGSTTPTGRNSDLAINGEGFFMVQSNGQQMFTRNGIFNLSADGYLETADGLRLQGFGATDSGQIQTGTMKDLSVKTGDMAAKTTSKVDLGLNLNANSAAINTVANPFDKEDPTTFTSSVTTTVYDSIGGEHEVTQYLVKTGDNQWKVHSMLDDETTPIKSVNMKFDSEGKLAELADPSVAVVKTYMDKSDAAAAAALDVVDKQAALDAANAALAADPTNKTLQAAAAAAQTASDAAVKTAADTELAANTAYAAAKDTMVKAANDGVSLTFTPSNGAKEQNLTVDVAQLSQYGSEFSINKNSQDGYAPGKLAGWYFETDGTVYARYSNGQTKAQGQVVLARFPNQEGLQQAGGTCWTQSFASGAPLTGVAGTGQMGELRTGMYEGSNVDLTNEMVGLMSAQSNYQANAKTIQVSQEMTQILFQNL